MKSHRNTLTPNTEKMETEIKTEKKISWKIVKTELQDKLKEVETEQDMIDFCNDVFGGFIYANKDVIKKSIMQSEMETGNMLKEHKSDMSYVG